MRKKEEYNEPIEDDGFKKCEKYRKMEIPHKAYNKHSPNEMIILLFALALPSKRSFNSRIVSEKLGVKEDTFKKIIIKFVKNSVLVRHGKRGSYTYEVNKTLHNLTGFKLYYSIFDLYFKIPIMQRLIFIFLKSFKIHRRTILNTNPLGSELRTKAEKYIRLIYSSFNENVIEKIEFRCDDKLIGEHLNISPATVYKHLKELEKSLLINIKREKNRDEKGNKTGNHKRWIDINE